MHIILSRGYLLIWSVNINLIWCTFCQNVIYRFRLHCVHFDNAYTLTKNWSHAFGLHSDNKLVSVHSTIIINLVYTVKILTKDQCTFCQKVIHRFFIHCVNFDYSFSTLTWCTLWWRIIPNYFVYILSKKFWPIWCTLHCKYFD